MDLFNVDLSNAALRERAEQYLQDCISPDTLTILCAAIRDAARAGQQELIAKVNDIANDCEQVSAMDIVGQAERRTWRSIASALRAAAIRSQLLSLKGEENE